ncbi:MAG: hypothetical protein AAF355_00340 [Myxococcota bacterium]
MFKEILKEVVDQAEGSIASVIMDSDGIPLEHYVRGSEQTPDVEAVGAEFSVVLNQVRSAAEMLEVGGASEIAIRAERLTTIIRVLTEEHFVALTLHPTGNFGKARYLLRRQSSRLSEALV